MKRLEAEVSPSPRRTRGGETAFEMAAFKIGPRQFLASR